MLLTNSVYFSTKGLPFQNGKDFFRELGYYDLIGLFY